MSSLRRKFIPFGQFNPDAPEIDNPMLEVANNCLPLFGSYRSLRKKTVISSEDMTDPITGAVNSLLSENDLGIMSLRPYAYSADSPFWDGFDAFPTHLGDQKTDALNTPWITIDDSGTDDGDFIACVIRVDTALEADAKFLLQAPTATPEPDDGGATKHVARFRYRVVGTEPGDTWNIDWEVHDSVGIVHTGTGETGTNQSNIPVDVSEDIVMTGHDPDTLEMHFAIYADAAQEDQHIPPVETVERNDWEAIPAADEDAVVDNIHQYIAEETRDDVDFIRSPYTGTKEDVGENKSVIIFRLLESFRPIRLDEGTFSLKITYRTKFGKEGANADVYLQWWEGNERTDIIEPIHIDNMTESWQLLETDITVGNEANSWADIPLDRWDDLHCKIVFNFEGDPETGEEVDEQDLDAAGLENRNGWVDKNGLTTDIWESIEIDSGDGTYVHRGFDNVGKSITFDEFEAVSPSEPVDTTEKPEVSVRVRIEEGPGRKNRPVQIAFDIDGETKTSGTYDTDKHDNFKKITLEHNKTVKWLRDHDANWENITVQIIKEKDSEDNTDWDLHVSEIDVNIPGAPGDQEKMEVSWLKIETPSAAHVRIQRCDVRLTADNTETFLPGDQNHIIAGNLTDLWTIDSKGAWTNRTLGGAGSYGNVGAGKVTPKEWNFTTYGNQVMATNYFDPIQVWDPTAGAFADLLTKEVATGGIVSVKARFIATIRSFLVVANVNPDSEGGAGLAATDARVYTLWWSGSGEPSKFYELDLPTLSSFAQLVSLPGEITGLVGGEYGIVFKRNSVWRMNFVGGLQLWTWDQVSASTGCAYPRSIVSVGNTVYFWGPTGIFVIGDAAMMSRSGQVINKISTQLLDKYLFDEAFEETALRQPTSQQDTENTSVVSAGFDPYSGLVWWAYTRVGDNYHRCNDILVFNPQTDRFTTLTGERDSQPFRVQAMVGIGNTYEEEQSYTRGIAMLTADAGVQTAGRLEKFQSSDMYEITLRTKTISSQLIAGEKQAGKQIQINQIRPIFRVNPEDAGNPNIAITIETAEDPSFQLRKTTSTVYFEDRNRDGWNPLGPLVSGEFFEFTVVVPVTDEYILKEFLGIQLQFKTQGEI